MISNRQGGRRRGRGGGQRSPNNVPNTGNRQDNRQRGNAAQLHEKYKALARDAQLSGDRVQTEYYLQFADHYFRVLNEGRARFEEQRRHRDDESGVEDDELEEAANASEAEDRPEQEDQEDRSRSRRNGADRSRGNGRRERESAADESANDGQGAEEAGEERISLDVLPPAIVSEDSARTPRRRARRPRPESDEEIAPAA